MIIIYTSSTFGEANENKFDIRFFTQRIKFFLQILAGLTNKLTAVLSTQLQKNGHWLLQQRATASLYR